MEQSGSKGLCGIVSQNVRCISGAFGTVITQVFYTCTYVNMYKSQYTLSPLCEHNRQKQPTSQWL